MRANILCITRAEPTTIRVRLSIVIGVDRPTAAILWKEDHVGFQHDWIIFASSSFTTERTTKTPLKAQNWMNSYRLRRQRQREWQRRPHRRKLEWIRIVFVIDKEEIDKDAAVGATMIESYWFCCHRQTRNWQRQRCGRNGGHRLGPHYRTTLPIKCTMCHVPCIRERRMMMRLLWSPGQRGRWTKTSNAPKSMKIMKSMK